MTKKRKMLTTHILTLSPLLYLGHEPAVETINKWVTGYGRRYTSGKWPVIFMRFQKIQFIYAFLLLKPRTPGAPIEPTTLPCVSIKYGRASTHFHAIPWRSNKHGYAWMLVARPWNNLNTFRQTDIPMLPISLVVPDSNRGEPSGKHVDSNIVDLMILVTTYFPLLMSEGRFLFFSDP